MLLLPLMLPRQLFLRLLLLTIDAAESAPAAVVN